MYLKNKIILIYLEETDEVEINNTILILKKGIVPSADGIKTETLSSKRSADYIAKSLMYLFNFSLRNAIFRIVFKEAIVKPCIYVFFI